MSQPDPREAILKKQAGPVGRAQFGPPGPHGWRAGSVEEGNWFEADLATVRFVKFRESSRRRLYTVTSEGQIPHLGPERHKLSERYPVERDRDGNWTAQRGAGGGGDSNGTSRPEPWVNLAGGEWRELETDLACVLPGHFYAGGSVHNAGVEVAHVQLRFADGVVFKTIPMRMRGSSCSSPTRKSDFRPPRSCSTAAANRSHRIPSPACSHRQPYSHSRNANRTILRLSLHCC